MRACALLCTACVASQAAPPQSSQEVARHLRYERVLQMPAQAAGDTCAVLDAETFAHMANRSGDDLRIFREFRETEGGPVETEFTLTESDAEAAEPQGARVQAASAQGHVLDFDLAMPHGAYTAVDLQVAASDFTAEATVTGSDGGGGRPVPLGVFTLFDFTREGLARSTELALQESRFPLLHLTVQFHNMLPTPATIAGATVPPSREAQTLHTVVAATSDLQLLKAERRMVATFAVPEHVPVEGIRIVLDPAWHGEFLRSVSILGIAGDGVREAAGGEVWKLDRPASADGAPAIHASHLAVESVLGVNLRSPATVTVSLQDGAEAPLPVRSVVLEMRQRMICFVAEPGARYTLRYGDGGLRAPVYKEAHLVDSAKPPGVALLGPETVSPGIAERPTRRQFAEGRSQILWIVLLAAVTLGGSLALHRVRRKG